MTEQEVQEIYNRLLELTKAGQIQWEKTGEKEFTTNFSRSSVSVETEGILTGEQAALKIYNDAGFIVAYAAPKTGVGFIVGPNVKEFNLDPSELYKLIEESLYKYSETSKSILDELKELELSQKGK
jgi:hypothetical protein